jgi:hypothetical protein
MMKTRYVSASYGQSKGLNLSGNRLSKIFWEQPIKATRSNRKAALHLRRDWRGGRTKLVALLKTRAGRAHSVGRSCILRAANMSKSLTRRVETTCRPGCGGGGLQGGGDPVKSFCAWRALRPARLDVLVILAVLSGHQRQCAPLPWRRWCSIGKLDEGVAWAVIHRCCHDAT